MASKSEKIPRLFPLRVTTLGRVTRALARSFRLLEKLHGSAFLVGGLVTEGGTLRDIDVVVTDKRDIPILKKALGKYAKMAHFILQKQEPPAPLYLKITNKKPRSPDLKKGRPTNLYEYAGPAD